MNLKRFLRPFIPPVLGDLYRKLFPTPTWEGVFSSFAEVKADGEGLNGKIWAKIVEEETRKAARELRGGKALPALLGGDHSLLPLLVSVVSGTKPHRTRILDFGGGAGIDYLRLQSSLSRMSNIEYHVVESARICERGRAIHRDDPRISFHESLPVNVATFDVIHMNSVLQYIEDYAALLKTLCIYGPSYFLFVRLSAGDIPTYVTRQVNVPGSCTAYQFLNVNELTRAMGDCGYKPAFRGAGDTELSQSNFAAEYRMGRTCNMLFVRNSEQG